MCFYANCFFNIVLQLFFTNSFRIYYDNVYIIVQAIEKVGLDADKIADHLHGLRNYQGVSGAIGFDANGDLLRSDYIVKIVRNGTAEELK